MLRPAMFTWQYIPVAGLCVHAHMRSIFCDSRRSEAPEGNQGTKGVDSRSVKIFAQAFGPELSTRLSCIEMSVFQIQGHMRKRARLRAAGPVLSTGLTPECVACTRGGCTAGTGCTWSRLQCNARVRSQVRAGWQHPVTGRVCRALAVSCTVTSGNVSHTDPVVERHFVMRGPRLPCNLPRQLTPAATWCSHMELSQSSHQGRAGTAARFGARVKGQ